MFTHEISGINRSQRTAGPRGHTRRLQRRGGLAPCGGQPPPCRTRRLICCCLSVYYFHEWEVKWAVAASTNKTLRRGGAASSRGCAPHWLRCAGSAGCAVFDPAGPPRVQCCGSAASFSSLGSGPSIRPALVAGATSRRQVVRQARFQGGAGSGAGSATVFQQNSLGYRVLGTLRPPPPGIRHA